MEEGWNYVSKNKQSTSDCDSDHGAGVLLAKLAEKDPQQEEEQSVEGNHREKDAFQEKEFDDIW